MPFTNPQLTVEANDFALGLLQLVIDNVTVLNSHPKLVSSGVLIDASLRSTTADDTSPYTGVKLGDRDILADGLTLCFLPLKTDEVEGTTGYVVDAWFRVDIIAYVKAVADPQGQQDALDGIAQALASLVNFRENYSIQLPSGAYASEVRAFERNWVYAGKSTGEIVPGVQVSCRAFSSYPV